MRSIFGWSLPPGCSMRDIDPPIPPCELCGGVEDECTCPECPECGEFGCIKHVPLVEFLKQYELAASRWHALKSEFDRRTKEAEFNCAKCGTLCKPSLFDGIDWCEGCNDYPTMPREPTPELKPVTTKVRKLDPEAWK